MKRKFLIGFAPLLAVAAFVAVPTAAQAATEPCYTKNSTAATACTSVKTGAGAVEVLAFGKLTLKTVVGGAGEVSCLNAGSGKIENNPAGKGEGKTELFATFNCSSSTCPAYTEVYAEKLPWPSLLEESAGPVFRAKTSGVKVNILCWASKAASEEAHENSGIGGKPLGGAKFVGSNEPELVNKASVSPQASLIEFEPAGSSGKLEAEGSGGTVLGQTEGHLEQFGTKAKEVLRACSGKAGANCP